MLHVPPRGFVFAIAMLMAIGPVAGTALAQSNQPAAAGIVEDGPESWEQEAKLLPSKSGGQYGNDVAIDDGRFIVGARDGALVDVFRLTNTGPSDESFPGLPDSSTSQFGRSVDIDGDLAVVGDEDVAFVFEDLSAPNAPADWTHVETLNPPDNPSDIQREWGASIAVDEATTTVVVGAPFEDTGSNGGRNAGAAFAYSLESGSWTLNQTLYSSTPDASDQFGTAVAIDGTTLLVGAPGDTDPGTRPVLLGLDEFPAGSVDVFVGDEQGWKQTTQLVGSHASEETRFGQAIAVDGSRAVVATTDPAYVFDGFPADPAQVTRLFPDERYTEDNSFFERQVAGWVVEDVALDDDTVMIGTSVKAAVQPGGNVDVFEEASDGSWSLVTELRQRDPRSHATPGNPGFGRAVALEGDTAVVGAWLENSMQGQFQGGAAYVFAPCTDDGALSGPVHQEIEPQAGPAEEEVHEVSCDVLASNGG